MVNNMRVEQFNMFYVFRKLFNTSCIKNTDSLISAFVLRPATKNIINLYQLEFKKDSKNQHN